MPDINGWTPPVVYDIATDKARVATQADIDVMERRIRIMDRFCQRTIESADELKLFLKVAMTPQS